MKDEQLKPHVDTLLNASSILGKSIQQPFLSMKNTLLI
jgi:hypothetical protein